MGNQHLRQSFQEKLQFSVVTVLTGIITYLSLCLLLLPLLLLVVELWSKLSYLVLKHNKFIESLMLLSKRCEALKTDLHMGSFELKVESYINVNLVLLRCGSNRL